VAPPRAPLAREGVRVAFKFAVGASVCKVPLTLQLEIAGQLVVSITVTAAHMLVNSRRNTRLNERVSEQRPWVPDTIVTNRVPVLTRTRAVIVGLSRTMLDAACRPLEVRAGDGGRRGPGWQHGVACLHCRGGIAADIHHIVSLWTAPWKRRGLQCVCLM
jgi:hypothetical protein